MKMSVKISGNSFDMNIGLISKDVLVYWTAHEDALAQALHSSEDQADVPEEYKLKHFTQYGDILNVTGTDMATDVSLQIISADGEVLYEGDLDDLKDIFFDYDEDKFVSEITQEFSQSDLPVGTYLVRTANGFHDIYFEEIDIGDDEFKITELKFFTKEIDGIEVISSIEYCGVEYGISEIQGDIHEEYFSLLEI